MRGREGHLGGEKLWFGSFVAACAPQDDRFDPWKMQARKARPYMQKRPVGHPAVTTWTDKASSPGETAVGGVPG